MWTSTPKSSSWTHCNPLQTIRHVETIRHVLIPYPQIFWFNGAPNRHRQEGVLWPQDACRKVDTQSHLHVSWALEIGRRWMKLIKLQEHIEPPCSSELDGARSAGKKLGMCMTSLKKRWAICVCVTWVRLLGSRQIGTNHQPAFSCCICMPHGSGVWTSPRQPKHWHPSYVL